MEGTACAKAQWQRGAWQIPGPEEAGMAGVQSMGVALKGQLH